MRCSGCHHRLPWNATRRCCAKCRAKALTRLQHQQRRDGWRVVRCPACKKQRRISWGAYCALRAGKTSGLCQPCTFRSYHKPRATRRGTQELSNGVKVHWSIRHAMYPQRGRESRVRVECSCGARRWVLMSSLLSTISNRLKWNQLRCSGCSARKGPKHGNWRGGRRVASDGVRLTITGLSSEEQTLAIPMANTAHGRPRRILEHRLVMAREIGRPLRTEEWVHHKDRDRASNKRDNLVFTTASQHPKDHADMVTWYVEELRRLHRLLRKYNIKTRMPLVPPLDRTEAELQQLLAQQRVALQRCARQQRQS